MTYSSMRDEFEKIANKTRVLSRLLNVSDNVAKMVLDQHRDRKRRQKEKKASLDSFESSSMEASGGSGFLSQPNSYAPSSELDPEGRLRTNDEPDTERKNKSFRTADKKAPKKKMRKMVNTSTTPFTTEDPKSGDYKGNEPLGVDRDFHMNHENTSPK